MLAGSLRGSGTVWEGFPPESGASVAKLAVGQQGKG